MIWAPIGNLANDSSRWALIRGSIAAIIIQDPGHEVRSAVSMMMAKTDNVPPIESQEHFKIDIFLWDNLP